MKRGKLPEASDASTSKKLKGCSPSCKELKQFICDIIKDQTAKFQDQNIKIMEALAEQNVLTKTLIREDVINGQLTAAFPLATESDLVGLNKQIDPSNKSVYIKIMKNIIRNNLSKNFTSIITEECLYSYNVDGSHGKKSLKDLTNFYGVIKSTVELIPGIDSVEGHIRRVIHLIKKRHLKRVLKERKENNQVEINPYVGNQNINEIENSHSDDGQSEDGPNEGRQRNESEEDS